MHYCSKLDAQFRIFKVIQSNSEMDNLAVSLKSEDKFAVAVASFYEYKDRIKKHNDSIIELEQKFNDIIKNHSIQNILSNLHEYPLEVLKTFNEVALKISEYTLPNDYDRRDIFTRYMYELGIIIDNYYSVKEQYELIQDYSRLDLDFGDRYIDAQEAERILAPARKIINSLSKQEKKFYQPPVLEASIVEMHNRSFIDRHIHDKIFDNINGFSLDEDQRRAVLCDPKSNLVIAGAGSGKTLTICGRVKYLIEEKGFSPNDILLLSYSSASAQDLAKKISNVSADVKVKTFHALGLEILNDYYGKKKAIEEQFLAYIKKYFDEELINNPSIIETVFNYFGYYLYSDTVSKKYENDGELFEDLKKSDFTTLKDRCENSELVNGSYETIKKEYVKSYEELVIANFLYVNGINYQYERAYEYDTSTPDKRQYTPDFYLTDYHIYLEHYGVDINGKTPQYTKEEEAKYIESMNWKRKIHAEMNTVCLETYSYQFKNGTIFENLKKQLIASGIELKPLQQDKINACINNIIQGKEFTSFINLVATFLNLYKAKYKDNTSFDKLLENKFPSEYANDRSQVFIAICRAIYDYYILSIREQGKIDFDDMILQATEVVNNLKSYKYKYIIVDEFQDISQSRAKFLQSLIKHGDSKMFAVGDDWQAIYRFAGCDISIFLCFDKYFEDTVKNYITSTHRNSQELQNVVEPFITANPEQYIKHIKSDLHQEYPVRVVYHNGDKVVAFDQALKEIETINPSASVLVLGRNRHDIDDMISRRIQVRNYDEIIHSDYRFMQISYKTVHQSKGLECDYVILISGEDAVSGFPNQIEDDDLLSLVLDKKGEYRFAEERRLFYVALTRTKSIVYLLSDKNRPSEFVKEIEERVKIENSEILSVNDENSNCPWCKSGKLVIREARRQAFYGCSNYPYCKYTINDMKAVVINNRCPSCGDFLVVRNGKNGKFIGCHNYPRCRYTKDFVDQHFKVGF